MTFQKHLEKGAAACYNERMETQFSYKILKSHRKTLSLTVTREGEVVVKAPLGVSKEYIEDFVEKHIPWIEKRLVAVSKRPKLCLCDGAELVLFGSSYLIKTGRARVDGGAVYLPSEKREEALSRLLKRFSLEVMGVLTERIAHRFGFVYKSVRISSARGRWGSCNRDGVIMYTFRVAFLPPSLLEYVIVHELSHTVFFDHSPAFWQVVKRVIPDWEARRKALKSCQAIDLL